MKYVATAIYMIGPLAVMVMLALMASMSRRLGQALELPPYYRLYYVSLLFFFIPLPAAWVLLVTEAWGLPDPEPLTGLILKVLVGSVPMSIAVTFALVATAKYWSWIWKELRQPEKDPGGGDGK